MSFVHELYIGKFDHEYDHVRYVGTVPALRSPLKLEDVAAALPHRTNENLILSNLILPNEWLMRFVDGLVIADKHRISYDARLFLGRLIESTGCEILDCNTGSLLDVSEIPISLLDRVSRRK